VTSIEKIAGLARESRFDSLGNTGGYYGLEDLDLSKVEALGRGTKYDLCCSSSTKRRTKGVDGLGSVLIGGLCHSFTPDGRCVSLFKTLYTNACTQECRYCTNSITCKNRSKIFSYTPEELARITINLYRGNYIEGLFLSSGMGRSEEATMEEMIEAVRLLRDAYHFRGYVHLKILPGSSKDHVKRAMELADRVSVNLEAASGSYMGELSPTKDYVKDILERQRYVRELSRKVRLPAGQTTQLVVGAAGESDRDIFDRLLLEYDVMRLRRVYYSAFTPVEGTAFGNKEKQPLWREHRLYQMDWLYRVYHFDKGEMEIAFDEEGFLSDRDPKETIARNLLDSPVDPNAASFEELIRVPGIGPKSAWRITELRRSQEIKKKSELKALGVRVNRAEPFLKLNGRCGTTLDRWLS
jgi:putative DNA modification/repair radical SAM protein